MNYYYKEIKTPVGKLKIICNDNGLAAILWENDKRIHLSPLIEDKNHPVLLEAEKQLKEYFSGERKKFDLKLDAAGTDFQKKVWKALTTIPFGKTWSYGELAKKIGNPKASRAVGAANGKNPISIVVPCHRVIGSSGKLTGFAGGLKNKEVLLNIEKN